MIVFFGVNDEGVRILSKAFKKKYKEQFVNDILDHYKKIYVKYKDEKKTKYYGGHQHRLGHYMRHFYQAINYANSDKPF